MYVEVAVAVPLKQTFTYKVGDASTAKLVEVGSLVVVPFANRKLIGVVLEKHVGITIDANKIKPVEYVYPQKFNLTPTQLDIIVKVSHYYHQTLGNTLELAIPLALKKQKDVCTVDGEYWQIATTDEVIFSKTATKQAALYKLFVEKQLLSWPELKVLGYQKSQITALLNKQLITPATPATKPFQCDVTHIKQQNRKKATVEQAMALAAIEAKMSGFACHLIEGITGSGKTEIYLQLMESVLLQQKTILMLVPEIGLTPQSLLRLEKRFDLPIYLYHSGMTDNERLQTWLAAKQGRAAIVLGTRSAVFLPFAKLGLIIVDEEHDLSFKQQDGIRYHARDVAIMRAKQLHISIVLGTATPSLEVLNNALKGQYFHHQLTKRAGSAVKSEIILVNSQLQAINNGIAATVLQQIQTTLARDEQVLVFLNRRGYAPAVGCQECFHVIHCHRCQKPFTYHHHNQTLVCHHCSNQKRMIHQCEACGSVRIAPLGIGTEQLVGFLQQQFSEQQVVRVDRDSMQRKGQLQQTLTQIAEHQANIIVGTQMLAKGHHFPDVTLVVILNLDAGLFSYDFHATEHLAQLITQVAGRAGRASKPGQVLLQTNYPEHPLLQDLVNNGYGDFARQELIERQQAQLPPYAYLAIIRSAAIKAEHGFEFLNWFSQIKFAHCQLAGPMAAPMEKKAGKWRYQLQLKSTNRRALHQALLQIDHAVSHNPWSNRVRWSIDVDPVDMN